MKFGEAKFRNWFISCTRRLTYKWKPRNDAKKRARVQNGETKTGKPKYGYQCSMCQKVFMAKEVQIDHIDPVIDPLTGFDSFDTFIERMFCQEDGFQVLCKDCHDIKTRNEKSIAKERRANAKNN